MKTRATFNADTITDQKRLVRGEHWLLTRSILRARDGKHHCPWRLLILFGPSPKEEIQCIKSLMPSAYIVAADLEEQRADAALEAGADEAFVGNIAKFDDAPRGNPGCIAKIPPTTFGQPFDAVCLDLTKPSNDWLHDVVKVYFAALTNGGVLMITLCYGRDVRERYQEFRRRLQNNRTENALQYLLDGEMPEPLLERVYYCLRSRSRYLRSALQYQGKEMPMLSLLLQKRNGLNGAGGYQFEILQPGDFELAVTAESIGNIYACPQERIIALRRSAAARKAVQTPCT